MPVLLFTPSTAVAMAGLARSAVGVGTAVTAVHTAYEEPVQQGWGVAIKVSLSVWDVVASN
jgi:hypothetical protein